MSTNSIMRLRKKITEIKYGRTEISLNRIPRGVTNLRELRVVVPKISKARLDILKYGAVSPNNKASVMESGEKSKVPGMGENVVVELPLKGDSALPTPPDHVISRWIYVGPATPKRRSARNASSFTERESQPNREREGAVSPIVDIPFPEDKYGLLSTARNGSREGAVSPSDDMMCAEEDT